MKKNYVLLFAATLFVSMTFAQQFSAVSNSQELTSDNRSENAIIWDQQPVVGGSGIVSDFFTGIPGGTYAADDFEITSNTRIETITAYGFQSAETFATIMTGLDVYIYTDNAGVPSSDPSTTGTGVLEIVNLDAANAAISTVINGSGVDITLDVTLANGGDFILTPGVYWLVVAPRMNMADNDGAVRWNWFDAGVPDILSETMLVDPDGVFGGFDWTALSALGVTFGSSAFTIEGQENLSVNDFSLAQVNLTPNPTRDTITINLHPSNNLERVKLYDVTGKLVYTGTQETTINLSNFKSGIYLLNIKSERGQITKRIVKM